MAGVRLTVCGYPRSGNVWLARLLGDALDVPVVGIQGGRGSLAAEGEGRPNPGHIKQAHLWPGRNGHHLNVDVTHENAGEFIVIVRDPRDVTVSASAYWDWTLDEALDKMIEGPGPLELPPWQTFVEAWLALDVPHVRYEDLWVHPEARLRELIDGQPHKPLEEVVARQAFSAKQREMRHRSDEYPFGREAQLRHLRRGITGEWRERFSPEQAARAANAWGALLEMLGYGGSDQ